MTHALLRDRKRDTTQRHAREQATEKPRQRLRDVTPHQGASGAARSWKRQGEVLAWSYEREGGANDILEEARGDSRLEL